MTADTSRARALAPLRPRSPQEWHDYRREQQLVLAAEGLAGGMTSVIEPLDRAADRAFVPVGRVADTVEDGWHGLMVTLFSLAVGAAAVAVARGLDLALYLPLALLGAVGYVVWFVESAPRDRRFSGRFRPQGADRSAFRRGMALVPPVVIAVAAVGAVLPFVPEPARLLLAVCGGAPIAVVTAMIVRRIGRGLTRATEVAVDRSISAFGAGVKAVAPPVKRSAKRSFDRVVQQPAFDRTRQAFGVEVDGYVTPALVGSPGRVLAAVPAGAYGRVQVAVLGGTHTCHAASRVHVPKGALVTVVAALGPDAVEVAPG